MKYFILAGWSNYLNKVVYWSEQDETAYTGWTEELPGATILDQHWLEYILDDSELKFKSKRLDVVDLKKIEVKLGEWENV